MSNRENGAFVNDKNADDSEPDGISGQSIQEHVQLQHKTCQ